MASKFKKAKTTNLQNSTKQKLSVCHPAQVDDINGSVGAANSMPYYCWEIIGQQSTPLFNG